MAQKKNLPDDIFPVRIAFLLFNENMQSIALGDHQFLLQ
jgi:hypothetical protein